MFDFHTHILPGIDDGSTGVEESIAMLRELKRQGVDGIAATPHFYADRISPDDFFARRQSSWEKLQPHLESDVPEIRLGAEVRYFEGINRYDGLKQFCIEGTNLLLLEMPLCVWTKRMVTALAELNGYEGITLLMAHIERYYHAQSKGTWDYLLDCGIRMQISTDFFINRFTRPSAMKLLRNERIHFLGTDCHDTKTRKPNMAEAVAVIQLKNEDAFLQRMEQREHRLLQEADTCQ